MGHAMPCHVASCHGMSWHGHHVCHVMSCHVMSCHVMSCSCHVMSCMSCHVCRVMSCHVVSCHVMTWLCRVMSCHVMSYHVMSCHVKLACHADPCRVKHNIIRNNLVNILNMNSNLQEPDCSAKGGGAVSARLRQLGPGTWCDKTVVFFAEGLPCEIDIHWDHIKWHAW